MKLTVVSNIVLDSIRDREGVVTGRLGGPGCYSGLTARRFSFDVTLATKINTDFLMYNRFLLNEGIMITDYPLSHYATTRFRLTLNSDNNTIRSLLFSKCVDHHR